MPRLPSRSLSPLCRGSCRGHHHRLSHAAAPVVAISALSAMPAAPIVAITAVSAMPRLPSWPSPPSPHATAPVAVITVPPCRGSRRGHHHRLPHAATPVAVIITVSAMPRLLSRSLSPLCHGSRRGHCLQSSSKKGAGIILASPGAYSPIKKQILVGLSEQVADH